MEIAIGYGKCGKGMDVPSILKKVQAFVAAKDIEVQLLDAAAIVNEEHVRSAVQHALRARGRMSMRSSALGMEILLYASGKRQIKDALSVSGVSGSTDAIAVVIVGGGAQKHLPELLAAIGAKAADARVAGGRKALERLGIDARGATEKQLEDLALEHVALLDIER
jgi:KEOPS complex subunit Cgi121